MRVFATVALILASLSLSACAADDLGDGVGHDHHDRKFGDRDRGHRHHRNDKGFDRNWRHLGEDDQVYRGKNGHYYCKRRDGTNGALVGPLTGDTLENAIPRGESRKLGTVLRNGGPLSGRDIDRRAVRCE